VYRRATDGPTRSFLETALAQLVADAEDRRHLVEAVASADRHRLIRARRRGPLWTLEAGGTCPRVLPSSSPGRVDPSLGGPG